MTKKELERRIEYLQEMIDKRLVKREEEYDHMRALVDEKDSTIRCLLRENRKLWQMLRIYSGDPTIVKQMELDIENAKKGFGLDPIF